MPAIYAHYRFGSEMLQAMPADLSRTAKRFRRLYDVGLHGPDVLFFYKPVLSTKFRELGHKLHYQTGREFFGRVCRNLRLEPSEEGQAYLYGVLCHYALDAACHPFIIETSEAGAVSHSRMETEFDRFLMERDGKVLPHRQSLTEHLRLTPEECRIAARFYPGVEPGQFRDALKSMVAIRKLLTMSDGRPQRMVKKTAGAVSQVFGDMIPRAEADPACAALNAPLLARYRRAAEQYPTLLLKLNAHLTYNAPLGEAFDPIFG